MSSLRNFDPVEISFHVERHTISLFVTLESEHRFKFFPQLS